MITCSESLSDRFKSSYDIELSFIENGVDHNYYKKASKSHKIEIRKKLKKSDLKIYSLNANQIAQEEIGRPIPNTVMLGALMKATGLMQMDTLVNGLTKKFKHKF